MVFKTGRRDVGVPRGALTPVAAPNVSPNVLLAGNRLRISGFAAIVLKDVAVRWCLRVADETSAFPGGCVFCFHTLSRGRVLRLLPVYFLLYLWNGCESLSETVTFDELPF